ncbi:uncharacterized protein LOC119656265 [Hermetia illucens]|uniref:uncharacterized protein LOC119656265 n=1 Tax=Hermetia illucens TaxID=343691 RepID=UPI0018CC6D99|nr:uncharacterized protein LOC119656265 [Hermetia illucens]
MSLISLLVNSVPRSDLSVLKCPYFSINSLTMPKAIVFASLFSSGNATTNFVNSHCRVNMYLYPFEIFNGPTVSICTVSKLVDGVSVLIIFSLVCLTCLFIWHAVQFLMWDLIILFIFFQQYRCFNFNKVLRIPKCPPWGHPGKCVLKGVILSVDEEYYPKDQCVKFICGEGSFAIEFRKNLLMWFSLLQIRLG